MKLLAKALRVWLLAASAAAFADAATANDLPRSDPAQGNRAAAIQAFVEAAEAQIDAVHSAMVLRHGRVIAEGCGRPTGRTTRT